MAVAAGRGWLRSLLRVLSFDVVVDVPVVQVVDVGVQLLDKVVLPVVVQDRGFGPDSAARGSAVEVLGQGGDMPVVATTGAVLGHGGDMPVVATTGAVLGQGC